ncbi:MAG: methyltransferase domain-containing protein [Elusimicrobia bacterium]|nr:methyltransferase domain-containing protein [Elusimicrobiota bacterium]
METKFIELKDSQVLYRPEPISFERDGVHVFVDGASPNWIAVDDRGAEILEWIDGRRTVGELRRLYAESRQVGWGKAWEDVHVFLREALRHGMLSDQPWDRPAYQGRDRYLQAGALKEFWIHLLQACNLSCSHCLVSSSPKGEKGLPTAFYKDMIDQAHALGARRFYFTGGEPFMREDIFDLIRHVTEVRDSELILLTNATLFHGKKREGLDSLKRDKIRFQVSLDGATALVNDKIRGEGVFEESSEGLRFLSGMGFPTSLTAAVTSVNLSDLESLPELAKELGARSVHLMWLHKRGRILEAPGQAFPSDGQLLALARRVKEKADALGVLFDNAASLLSRVNGQPGVKYDLGNLCWESLCLYMDGHVYPSAAMAGHSRLNLGDARRTTLESLWRESAVAQGFRLATVADSLSLRDDPFRFLTGGGDMEHSYFFSQNGKEGTLSGQDPYYPVYVELMKDIMAGLALEKARSFNNRSGFNSPVILHAMGEGSITCSEDAGDWLSGDGAPFVKTLHSNCVLSFDVEKPYRIIQKFYGAAAEKPQAELCCPVKYDAADVGHIPQDVLDRFYGCGSPIAAAQVKAGETTLDLGSGAGIDVFTAAKKVGPAGRAIGVDMTDQMLEVAQRCKPEVARNLGFDVAEFRKGYLEKIPVEDKTVDLVTSNCVINLSPDKSKVFAEIWRVLKDTGRMVVADIVADHSVPLNLQAHRDLWGECISGSLSEEEFLTGLERAGFYGITVLKKTFWKEVEGHKFFSITVRGYKFEKKVGCRYIGQQAVYLGPGKAFIDEEGHLFPRNETMEVYTDTAAKLSSGAYAGQFRVLGPDGSAVHVPAEAVAAGGDCCEGGACC